MLGELVGADLGQLELELGKAIAWVGGEGTIRGADVEQVCSVVSEAVIWDLTDAIIARDPDRGLSATLRMLDDAGSGGAHRLLQTIAWQIRQLLELQESLRAGRDAPGSLEARAQAQARRGAPQPPGARARSRTDPRGPQPREPGPESVPSRGAACLRGAGPDAHGGLRRLLQGRAVETPTRRRADPGHEKRRTAKPNGALAGFTRRGSCAGERDDLAGEAAHLRAACRRWMMPLPATRWMRLTVAGSAACAAAASPESIAAFSFLIWVRIMVR